MKTTDGYPFCPHPWPIPSWGRKITCRAIVTGLVCILVGTLSACRSTIIQPTPTVTPLPKATLRPTPLPTPTLMERASTSLPEQVSPDVVVDLSSVIGESPIEFGVNGWWTDEDAEMWQARYAEVSPRVVRLPLLQAILEPENDDADPAHINWDGFGFEKAYSLGDRHLTYRNWLLTLRDLDITVMLYTPYLAEWLSTGKSTDPLAAPFPPKEIEEYGEFVQATLEYLVHKLGYPPERIILEPVNEADLDCGEDPAVTCFWKDWEKEDLLAVVETAHTKAKAVDERIRIVGLAFCCGSDLLAKLHKEANADQYLDGISFHYYEWDYKLTIGLNQAKAFLGYGKPVYLNEYGSRTYWSNGVEGALWHAAALPQFWQAGVNPLQFSISEWPSMHEGYNELGLFGDWHTDWKLKPAYWVYVNFFNLMRDTELIAASAPEGTVVLAGHRPQGRPQDQTLVVWVTNGTFEPQAGEMILQIKHWPAKAAKITVYNNLEGLLARDALDVTAQGDTLTFAYALPVLNSYTFVIQPVP